MEEPEQVGLAGMYMGGKAPTYGWRMDEKWWNWADKKIRRGVGECRSIGDSSAGWGRRKFSWHRDVKSRMGVDSVQSM